MPASVIFTGHMLDRPGRSTPRFPAERAAAIGLRIAHELKLLDATDGYGSAACGGDILFHESMLERGGRCHVVLPCNVGEFRRDCVDLLPDGDWGERFDRILDRASTLEILGEQYASDNAMASECCGRVFVGLAARGAAAQGEEAVVLALWDGRPGDAFGGTHSMVQFCQAHGFKILLMGDLGPERLAQTHELPRSRDGASSAIRHPALVSEAPQQICAVAFVDAVGFSKLRERELPIFSRHYLAGVMRALEKREIVPLVKNTWGDGLYMVFASVREAGLFALDFRAYCHALDWMKVGLRQPIDIRVGLHACPLYRIYDPVLGQWSYVGSNVTKAARIEPGTPSGEVYASRAFAALAAAERVLEYRCLSAGRMKMAKEYGEMEAYRLEAA